MTAAQPSPSIRSPRLSPTSAQTQRPAPTPNRSPRLTMIPPFDSSSIPCRARKAQKGDPASPLFATLTHSLSRKSFPCHSYANTRDVGATFCSYSGFFPSVCSVPLWQIPLFLAVADSLPSPKTSTPLSSSKSNLFFKNRAVWGDPSSPSFRSYAARASQLSSSQSSDTSYATWAYPIHPMSIASSGVQVHG
jgi:hypothetical protein